MLKAIAAQIKENFILIDNKHSIEITELNPSITYTYIIGKDDYSFTGTFKSLSSSNSEEVCKFAYLADTQVASKSDAKVVNATFNYLNNYKDLGFIYIGGDLTDNSDSKEQWEGLFESNGIYKTGGKDSLSNNFFLKYNQELHLYLHHVQSY